MNGFHPEAVAYEQKARSSKAGFFSSAIWLGFLSISAQVIFLRELASSLGGNELALGLFLGSWLLWTGVGSLLADKIRWRSPLAPAFAFTKAGLFFPLSLLAIRLIRPWLGILPGEVVGFLTVLPIALVLVAPLGFIVGALFVLLSRTHPQTGTNRVYLLEALGAALGGLLSTFILIPHLSNLAIGLLIGSLTIFVGFGLTSGGSRISRVLSWIALPILLLLTWLIQKPLERWSLSQQWKGFEIIRAVNSPYGALTVVRQAEQVSVFQQSSLVFSYPDPLSAEEAVHFGLLEHPHPRTALLIGNGLGGAITEALKYPALAMDYVDLDPSLVSLTHGVLPEQRFWPDSRVSLHLTDARRLLSRSRFHYDIILLNLPVPSTAQLNRFYTREFFTLVKDHLSPGGIFSFRIPSDENYLSPELADFLSSMRRTLSEVFPEVTVLPGGNAIFIASEGIVSLTRNSDTLMARLQERNIPTDFVSPYYLPDRLAPFRLEQLDASLDKAYALTNTDSRPICYYFDALLLSSHFRTGEKGVVSFFSRIPLWAFALLFCVGLLIVLLRGPSSWPLFTIISAGLSSMALEVVCLIAFQTYSGALYSGIGLLLAAFMLGLFFGSWLFQKARRLTPPILRFLQAGLVLLPLLLILLLHGLPVTAVSDVSDVLFPLFLGITGIVCGAVFPVANSLYLRSKPRALGMAYGLDLLSACFGAILTSAVFIPLHGMTATLLLLAFLALLPLLALLV